MDIVANGPFRFAQLRWVLSAGAPAITVICKATYLLRPAEAPLATEQEAPLEEDTHWNDDTEKSLSAATDLVPFKKQPEVVLVGHAFAPRGLPVRSLSARLVVGNVNKAIEIYGERVIALDGQLDDGASFQKMRLSYERAAGGPDSANPVGVRFDVQDAYGRTRLPNLQPPGSFVARRGDMFAPIGFGPIAAHWPERRRRFHHMAQAFATRAWTERHFPEGVDAGCFNVAPLDQRLEALHSNERITLENLHPDHPRLTTSLAGLELAGVVERPGQPPQKLVLACDTLWIDTDRQVCHLVWRGTVALTRPDESGRIVLSASARAPVKADFAHLAGLPSMEDPSSTTIAPFMGAAALPTLPFAVTTSRDDSRGGGPRRGSGGGGAALPFSDPSDPSPRPPVTSPAAYVAPAGPPDGTLFLDAAETAALAAIMGPPEQGQPGIGTQPNVAGQGVLAAPPPVVAQPAHVLATAPLPPPLGAAPPEMVIGPPIVSGAWGAGLSEPVPADKKGSIGERLAAEQAMAESKAALDKKVRGEPESLGPIQKAAAVEPPVKVLDEAAAKRGWKPAGAKKAAGAAAAGAATGAVSVDILRGGAAAASNAVLTPEERLARAPIAEQRVRQAPREILELLWFDPSYLPRIRRKPEWKDILAVARTRTFDDDPGPDAPPEKRQEARDRKEIFTLLARGTPMDMRSIEEAMDAAVNEDGCFIPPLVLVAGEITFPFDEVETLKATIAAVTPLIGEDKRLQGAVDTAQKLLQTPWIAGASELAETQTLRIKEAFAAGSRSVPGSYLEHHTEKMLLHQRAYRKRVVLGEEHVRGELALGGKLMPVYLPEAAGRQLPALPGWSARIVAEGRRKVDWRDAAEMTLRVGAVATRTTSSATAAQGTR